MYVCNSFRLKYFIVLCLIIIDDVMGLFTVKIFSENGSAEYQKEQATYMFFKRLLLEMEGIYTSLSC